MSSNTQNPLDAELNGPNYPTQLQADIDLIELLAATINGCHYSVNRRRPSDAVLEIRQAIEGVKNSREWRQRFNRSQSDAKGEPR